MKINGTDTVSQNMTLTAGWRDPNVIITYTVTFNSNGGSSVPPQTVPSGGGVTWPTVPTLSDYTFVDWYRDADLITLWDFGDSVTGNMTLYAGWLYNDDIDSGYGGDN
ncbi:MAG: InlB B-repeat-containing protein [Synergistaceae bacterium]|nr:InlB B-repeat-containing protein [Synergistaceae bacterium]